MRVAFLTRQRDHRGWCEARQGVLRELTDVSEPVEPALSSVEVRAADGTRMDRGDLRGDAADRTQLRLTLLPLTPNTYRVVWRVVSVDTHRTNGSFPFRVEP